MRRHNRLAVQVGYLRNVRLKASVASGVTRADLEAAQVHAWSTIKASLGGFYVTAAWGHETPPVVERIADMLSSAEVLRLKYARGDVGDGDDLHLPSVLTRDAQALLGMIRRGDLAVVAKSGDVPRPLESAPGGPPSARRQETITVVGK